MVMNIIIICKLSKSRQFRRSFYRSKRVRRHPPNNSDDYIAGPTLTNDGFDTVPVPVPAPIPANCCEDLLTEQQKQQEQEQEEEQPIAPM
jgi:hypothetical protein